MGRVKSFPASDAKLFPEYLFPRLDALARDPEAVVVTAFAERAGAFATAARRFVEISSGDAETPNKEALEKLRSTGRRWVVRLLTEAPSPAKLALLNDLPRWCRFFGIRDAQEALVPHLITFLNDADWRLRDAFCGNAAGVAAFLGAGAAETFVLPCLGQALADSEPRVASRALDALASLAELKLLSLDVLAKVCAGDGHSCAAAPLLLHPSSAVRRSASGLVAAAVGGADDPADAEALLLVPVVQPFLERPPGPASGADFGERLLRCAKPPLNAAAFSKLMDGGEIDDLDECDRTAASLMRGYVDAAARHARQRRNASVDPASSGSRPRTLSVEVGFAEGGEESLEELVRLSYKDGGPRVGGLVSRPDVSSGAARSLRAPDQKFAGLMAAVSTTTRANGGDDADALLRRRFGVLDGKRSDRAAALDASDLSTEDAAAFVAARGGDLSSAGFSPADPGASTTLRRRVRALDVPPLPPAGLPPLRQPADDRPFSWYASPLDLEDPGASTAGAGNPPGFFSAMARFLLRWDGPYE